MYSHLRWTWGCANVLIRRGVNVTGIGQLIILLSPPVLDVSNKRIHLTWPVSTCQDNQKWILETAAPSSEERIWGVEDVINLLSPAANTKWIPYKQQMPILCMYCTNDFLNVSENPFNTHYVPSQLWIGQELLSFVLYYCITIVPFDFWVNEVKWKEIKLFFHPDKLGWYLICCISKVCWYSTCNVFSHYVLRYNCFVFQRKWISIVNRSCSFFPKNCNGHTYTKLF